MSKSLGNSPDPLEVIAEYGADALRFTVIYLAPLGQDVLFSTDKCEFGRNFANKIWNAGRFLLMNADNISVNKDLADKHVDLVDKWIASRFNSTLLELNKAMDKFEINNAAKLIYSFIWNDFCDWYIELSKNKFYADDQEIKSAALTRAISMFENLLKIVHPFMPYISEELWQLIEKRKDGESISTSAYPVVDISAINTETEREMTFLQDIITAVRTIRGEMNIAPSKPLKLYLKTNLLKQDLVEFIKKLTRAEEIFFDENITKPEKSASALIKGCEIFIPLEGLIDLDLEKNRLMKEIQRIEGGLIGVTKKLSNESFVKNAPADVVEKENQKKNDWESSLSKLKEILQNLD